VEQSVEKSSASRILPAMMQQGFHAALLYCGIGLALELAAARLPPGSSERIAAAIYGLPRQLLVQFGFDERLVRAVAHGELPTWLGRAVVPAVGVGSILVLAAAVALVLQFATFVLSFKQR
jgi:hypothetical protein